MRSLLILSVMFTLLTWSSVGAGDHASVGREVREALEGSEAVRVLVYLRIPAEARASLPERQRTVARAQEAVLAGVSRREFRTVRRFGALPALAGEMTAEGLLKLSRHPLVARIDRDAPTQLHLGESVPLIGADSLHASGFTGAGITVAVIDSGVDTDHPDLADDLVDEACFCSNCCPGGGSMQFGPGSAEDDNGHGSHVAGIITSGGIVSPVGVAPDAAIVAIKVLAASNTFLASEPIAALDWIVTDQPDVDVVNMSLGTFAPFGSDCDLATGFTQAYAEAVNLLRARGTLTMASAGNDGLFGMGAPACVANVISVGATYDADVGSIGWGNCSDPTTAPDQITCFSNTSGTMDLFAPGALTTSANRFGGTAVLGGTSMASPHVAGCAAVLMQKNPDWTADNVEQAMEGTGVPIFDPRTTITFPRLDCAAAAQAQAQLVHESHGVVDTQRGNGNAVAEPGDVFALSVTLRNLGSVTASSVTGTLSTTTPGVTVLGPTASWISIPQDAVRTSSPPHFEVQLAAGVPCGSTVNFTLTLSTDLGPGVTTFPVQVGSKASGAWLSADTPLALPDDDPSGITSSLVVPDSLVIGDVTATVDISHTAIGDLVLDLTSPEGTTVRLHDRTGGATADLVTIYDTATAPDGPGTMNDFDTEDVAGTWTLTVRDESAGEVGTLNSWSLAAEETAICDPVPCHVIAVAAATPDVICDGESTLLEDTGSSENGTDCAGTLEFRFEEGVTVLQDWSADPDLSVSPSASTSFDFRVRDAGTLASAQTFLPVTVLASPSAAVAQSPDPMCEELPTLALDGGAGFSSYEWRDDGGAVVGTARTLDLDPSACGRTFTLEVTNADGCADAAAHPVSCIACLPSEVSPPAAAVPFRMAVDAAGTLEFQRLPDDDLAYHLYSASSIAAMLAGDWTFKYCDLESSVFGTWMQVDAETIHWTPLLPGILGEGHYVVVADRMGVEGPFGTQSSGAPRPADLDGSGSAGSFGCP